MPGFLVPLAIAGLSALGGALGNRKSTSTQESTTTGTATNTPQYDPRALDFRNAIINNFLSQLQGGGDFGLGGYEANRIEDINHIRELQKQKLRENLAARGIFGPAAELAVANVDNDRFKDIIGLKNETPLLRTQLMSDIASRAGNFFNTIPYGSTATSTQNMRGTATQPGNMLGGGIGGGASALAYLYGQGAFGGGGNGGGSSPLFSSRNFNTGIARG